MNDCNPAIGGRGHPDVCRRSSSETLDAWAAVRSRGPVGSSDMSSPSGRQALLIACMVAAGLGLVYQCRWELESQLGRIQGVQTDVLMLTGATPMWLASVLVIAARNLQRKEVTRPKAKWWQKSPRFTSARIIWKILHLKKTRFESQPVPAHCTTCFSYLIYPYVSVYLYVKKDRKKIRKYKLTFKKIKIYM